MIAGGAVDAQRASLVEWGLGLSYEGWLTSGVGLIVFACVVRFQAIGYGAVTTGLSRVPSNMMEASRLLGRGFAQSVRLVMLPLVRLSCIA